MAQGGSNCSFPIPRRVVTEKMEVLSSQGYWLTSEEAMSISCFGGKLSGCREHQGRIFTLGRSEYWDMLPRELVESSSQEIFKVLLDKALDNPG